MPLPIIHIRYVGFGTNFTAKPGQRTRELVKGPGQVSPDEQPEGFLFTNEVAVDVGGVCAAANKAEPFVLDHHFENGEFASAAAAVLGRAALLLDRLAPHAEVWIVTHRNPDFDALCAVWLARAVLLRTIPASYTIAAGPSTTGADEALAIKPDSKFPRDPRTPRNAALILAHYAARIDHARLRQIVCPRAQTLHAVFGTVLYRNDGPGEDGMASFFDEVFELMTKRGLHPFFDSIFLGQGVRDRELELIATQERNYDRDLRRAHKTIISLPCNRDFSHWFGKLKETPFLREVGNCLEVDPRHIHEDEMGSQGKRVLDALFLTDPECLFFKEWVRIDQDNSSLGDGFTFTAIAYSNRRPKSGFNTRDYFFSVDPERADGAHLYPLWVELQKRQIQAIRENQATMLPDMLKEAPRKHYKTRAGKNIADFSDPWFEAPSYYCTLIATPEGGAWSLNGAPPHSILGDAIMGLAWDFLRNRLFKSCKVDPYPTDNSPGARSAPASDIAVQTTADYGGALGCQQAVGNSLRFCSIEFAGGLPTAASAYSERVADLAWPILNGADSGQIPDYSRHVVLWHGILVVWSRRGIAVCRASSLSQDQELAVERLKVVVKSVAEVVVNLRELQRLIGSEGPKATANGDTLEESRLVRSKVLSSVVSMRLDASLPDGVIAQRFLDEIDFEGVMESLDTLNEDIAALAENEADLRQAKRDRVLQFILAWGTALGLLFSWNSAEGVKVSELLSYIDPNRSAVFFACGLVISIGFLIVYWFKARDKDQP
jgi:hypothetical protein